MNFLSIVFLVFHGSPFREFYFFFASDEILYSNSILQPHHNEALLHCYLFLSLVGTEHFDETVFG